MFPVHGLFTCHDYKYSSIQLERVSEYAERERLMSIGKSVDPFQMGQKLFGQRVPVSLGC